MSASQTPSSPKPRLPLAGFAPVRHNNSLCRPRILGSCSPLLPLEVSPASTWSRAVGIDHKRGSHDRIAYTSKHLGLGGTCAVGDGWGRGGGVLSIARSPAF
jgi:hypothetical protein